MANVKIKTEHAGAKNGDRSYTRAEAKEASKKRRRDADKLEARQVRDEIVANYGRGW